MQKRFLQFSLLLSAIIMTGTTALHAQGEKITFTTDKVPGEAIKLKIDAAKADRAGVWIDLNNNQIKDEGEAVTKFDSYVNYTIAAQRLTLYGKVSWLYCVDNKLQTLNVSQNTALTVLLCLFNKLQTLDVSKNTALTMLSCFNNQLQTLNVSQNKALTKLDCSFNPLQTLDVSKNTALTKLYCYNNKLQTLDVSTNTALIELSCENNQLQSLNLCKNTVLGYLNCRNNQLQSLNVANGNNTNFEFPMESNYPAVNITGNPALTCIQVDAGFDPTGLTGIKEWRKDATARWNNDVSKPCGSQTATKQ